MVTEVLQINIVESGSRTVKRAIDDIGHSADRLTHGLYLMRRALFTIGVGGALAGLVNMLDTLTAYENRLRLTSTSVQNMEGVQRELFAVAQRSRTEFAAVADVYSRTALSARRLGLSQKEVIDITESLSKAAILSGANSREANAALVQLSQGLAANRLGGDELRSILEQLPYVADVIADYMTSTGKFGQVSRAELKKLGSEGKITADIITSAFAAAKGKIDTEFSNTQSTIGQAVTRLGNAFLEWMDRMDDSYQISKKVADGINWMADNFDTVIAVIETATAAIIAFYAAPKIAVLATAIAQLYQYSAAVRSGSLVLLGSANAELMRANYLRQVAAAEVLAANASVAHRAQKVASLQTSVAELRQMQLASEYTVVNGRARSVLTGQFVNQERAQLNLMRSTMQLAVAEKSLAAQQLALAEATTVATAAQGRAAGAQAGVVAAQARASGFWARMANLFPVLTLSVTKVGNAFKFLGGFIRTPLGAVIAFISAIVGGTAAIVFFGDKIQVGTNKLVTLQDVAMAVVNNILNFFSPVARVIGDAFSAGFSFVMDVIDLFNTAFVVGMQTIMLGALTIVENTFGLIVGVASGVKAAVVAAWNNFPAAFELIFVTAVNLAIAAIQFLINTTAAPLKGLLAGLDYITGKNMAGEFFNATQIPTMTASAEAKGVGAAIGTAFADGFNEGRQMVDDAIIGTANLASSTVSSITNSIYADATKLAQDRAATNALIAKAQAITTGAGTGTPGSGTPGAGGGGGAAADLAKYIDELEKEMYLNTLIGNQKAAQVEIDKIEEGLKRSLTDAERQLVTAMVAHVEVSKEMGAYLEKLEGPQMKVANQLEALNTLFEAGRITVRAYRDELRNLAVDSTGNINTFFGGMANGLARVAQQANDFGSNVSDWIVDAFASATDAIVNFANTGEFNMREFFNGIFSNLLKLATNQLFSMLLSSMGFGAPGGAISGLAGLFPGFASGGSIMPSGTGTTDTQFVAFNKRPDERVDILTPDQQRRQAAAMGGGASGGTTSVQANTKIINVIDPAMVGDYMATPEGEKVVLNVIRRNGGAVKAVVNG